MFNDGMAHVLTVSGVSILEIALLMGAFINAHLLINIREGLDGYPGARTILAYGAGCSYVHPDLMWDDFFFVTGTSANTNDTVVAYNPSDFQMNTAFSKSYLLDSLGSRYGLGGNHFYIDQSFLDFIELIKKENTSISIKAEDDDRSISYCVISSDRKGQERFLWGYEMSHPIKIEYHGWNTNAYKIYKYYSLDESLDSGVDMTPPYTKHIEKLMDKNGVIDLKNLNSGIYDFARIIHNNQQDDKS